LPGCVGVECGELEELFLFGDDGEVGDRVHGLLRKTIIADGKDKRKGRRGV
jgi:hypothetical protein